MPLNKETTTISKYSVVFKGVIDFYFLEVFSLTIISYNPSLGLFTNWCLEKVVIVFYVFILIYCLLGFSLSNCINSRLSRRGAVLQSAFFYKYRLKMTRIFLCLSESLLTIPRAPTFIGATSFNFLFLGLCIYLFYYILWLICYHLLTLTY